MIYVTSQYAVCFNLVCVHSARIPARLPACLLRASQEVVVLAVAPVFFLQMSLKATMAAEAAQHSARVTPTKVKVGAEESFFEQGFDMYRSSSGGSAGSGQSPHLERSLDDSFGGASPSNVARRSPSSSPNRPASTSPGFADGTSEDAALCDLPIASAVFGQYHAGPVDRVASTPSKTPGASAANPLAVRLCRQCGRTEADAATEKVPLLGCPLCGFTFCDWCCRNEVVIHTTDPDDAKERLATNELSAHAAGPGKDGDATTPKFHSSNNDDESPRISTCVVCDECYGNSPAVTFEQPPNLRELALQVCFSVRQLADKDHLTTQHYQVADTLCHWPLLAGHSMCP